MIKTLHSRLFNIITMSKFSNLTKLSFVLNILLLLVVSFFIGKRFLLAKKSDNKDIKIQYAWNDARKNLYTQLPISDSDIVFLGNSLSEGFPLNEMFHSLAIKNRGIAGNKTSHILARLDVIVKQHPKKIFLEAGINDLIAKISVDSTFKNYKKIITTIRSTSPKTTIVVQLTLPTCKEFAYCIPDIIALNKDIANYCKEEKIKTVDLYTPFYKSGGLDSSVTEDGVHLNGTGYLRWKNEIAPIIFE
jgi:lysophospholipase L1-like esterase